MVGLLVGLDWLADRVAGWLAGSVFFSLSSSVCRVDEGARGGDGDVAEGDGLVDVDKAARLEREDLEERRRGRGLAEPRNHVAEPQLLLASCRLTPVSYTHLTLPTIYSV